MDEPEPPKQEQAAAEDRDRRIANFVLLAFFLVVVGIGIWLANAMIDYRKTDDCLARGARNCGPTDRCAGAVIHRAHHRTPAVKPDRDVHQLRGVVPRLARRCASHLTHLHPARFRNSSKYSSP